MPAPRAVVFDMDGLMFNTEEVYFRVGAELCRRRGHVYSRELSQAMMGLPPQPCFETMIRWLGLREDWQAIAAESQEIYLGILDEAIAPMPGLTELLGAVERAGLPKAVCTSSSREAVDRCLGYFQLAPRFAFVLTSEDITHGKPHPEIYLLAARRFGIAPREMVVLEDSQIGCRAAAAAGALTVAVPGEHSREQDFGVAHLVADGLGDPRLYAAIGLPAPQQNGSSSRET